MVENEYAKALYEIAQENKKEEQYRDYFRILMTLYFEDEDFKKLLNSPFIDKDEKKTFLKNTFGKVFDEDFLNFLYVVIDHNRAYKLVDIKDEYKKLVLNFSGIVRIYVKSARELSLKELKDIEISLKDRYPGKKLELRNEVDEALIGGIRITANDESIDLSLKSSLEKLKSAL
ncbi:MAG: ATP synthase F1 subunit delta [Acholeplasmatales bacterium]|nr:ATP synthase F1 subunit delta [Acholeplasmatales bacterium]